MNYFKYFGFTWLFVGAHFYLAGEVDCSRYSYQALQKVCAQQMDALLEIRIDLHSEDPELLRSTADIARYITGLLTLLQATGTETPYITCDRSANGIASCCFSQHSDGIAISGRIMYRTNNLYLTVSAPGCYDPTTITAFTKNFFKARTCATRVALRRHLH